MISRFSSSLRLSSALFSVVKASPLHGFHSANQSLRLLSIVSTYRTNKQKRAPRKIYKPMTEKDLQELEKIPGEDDGDPYYWKEYKQLMETELFPLDNEVKPRRLLSPEEVSIFVDRLKRYSPQLEAKRETPVLIGDGISQSDSALHISRADRLHNIFAGTSATKDQLQVEEEKDVGINTLQSTENDSKEVLDGVVKSDAFINFTEQSHLPAVVKNVGQKLRGNWNFRMQDFTRVITSQALTNDPRGALRTFDLMKEKGFNPDSTTYTAALMACGRGNMPERALALFKELKETMKPTYFNYGALVDALGRCKYIKEAFQTMDEMIVEEIKVSEKVYHSLLRACMIVQDFDSAFHLFHYMRREGISIDKRTFSTMIFCDAKAGNLERANNFFEDMQTSGIFPDRVAFTALIYAHAKRGNKEEAFNLMQTMAASGALPDLYTCNAALFAFARTGDVAGSLKVMQYMTEREIDPDVVSYNTLLHAYANGQVKAEKEVQEQNIKDASKLFEEMKDLGFKYTTHSANSLVRVYAEADKIEQALALINKFSKWRLAAGPESYHPIVKSHVRNSKYSDAFTLCNEIKAKDVSLDYRIYEQLFMACCRMKSEKKLLETLESYMEWRKGLKPLKPESEVLKRPWMQPPNADTMMNVDLMTKEEQNPLMTEHTRKMILKNFQSSSAVLERMIELGLAKRTPNKYDFDVPSPSHGLSSRDKQQS